MKYILNILAILIVIFLVKAIVNFKNNPDNKVNEFFKKPLSKISEFLKIQKQNISVETNPDRRRPITLMQKEVILKEFDPEVFGNFDDKDWEEFWDVIYGPIKKKKGNLFFLKFRNREEMEAALLEKYPRPFLYFDRNYWNIFWNEIIGIKFKDEEG